MDRVKGIKNVFNKCYRDSLCKYRLCFWIEKVADVFSLAVFLLMFCSFSVFLLSCIIVFLLKIVTRKSEQDPNVIKQTKLTQGLKQCEVCRTTYSLRSFPQHRHFCARQHQAWLATLPRTLKHRCTEQHQLAVWPVQELGWVCSEAECGTEFSRSDGQNRFSCFQCGFDLCTICLRDGETSIQLVHQGKEEQIIVFPDKKWIKGFSITSTSPEDQLAV